MTSQGDRGHHHSLQPTDLVPHMDDRDAFSWPDSDDPVFFETVSSTCLYVFTVAFHCAQIALNHTPSL